MTQARYQEFVTEHPGQPSLRSVREAAAGLGLNFSKLRERLIPAQQPNVIRAKWDLQRCETALQVAQAVSGEKPLTHRRYASLAATRDDLPHASTIDLIARQHGMTFGQLRDLAMGE